MSMRARPEAKQVVALESVACRLGSRSFGLKLYYHYYRV